MVKAIVDDARRKKKDLAIGFIDLKNAYNSIPQDLIWVNLQRNNAGNNLPDLLKCIYENHTILVDTKEWKKELPVESGVLQGDPLSPTLANLALKIIIRHIHKEDSYKIGQVTVNSACYCDDLALIAYSKAGLEKMLLTVSNILDKVSLEANPAKCASMTLWQGKRGPDA